MNPALMPGFAGYLISQRPSFANDIQTSLLWRGVARITESLFDSFWVRVTKTSEACLTADWSPRAIYQTNFTS